jgi:hypothetical protein
LGQKNPTGQITGSRNFFSGSGQYLPHSQFQASTTERDAAAKRRKVAVNDDIEIDLILGVEQQLFLSPFIECLTG